MSAKREIEHAVEHLNDMRTINLYAEMLNEYHTWLVEKLGEEEAEYVRKFIYKEASIKAERHKLGVNVCGTRLIKPPSEMTDEENQALIREVFDIYNEASRRFRKALGLKKGGDSENQSQDR